MDVGDVRDDSIKPVERHSDKPESRKVKVDMVELKEVSKRWRMEAMDADYVAKVNDAHGGRKREAKTKVRLTDGGEVRGCDRA